MKDLDIIRSWKDAEYKLGLEDSSILPENPAGRLELSDADLNGVVGARTEHLATIGCCDGLTMDRGYCTLLFCTFTCYPFGGTYAYTCAIAGC